MERLAHPTRPARPIRLALLAAAALGLTAAVASLADLPDSAVTMDQVMRGRHLVTTGSCTLCHNRQKDDPSDPHWLAGYLPNTPQEPFLGPFREGQTGTALDRQCVGTAAPRAKPAPASGRKQE